MISNTKEEKDAYVIPHAQKSSSAENDQQMEQND